MLLIEFKKGKTKDMLVCTRQDGTSTWMEMTPALTLHDLAHYVVEKELNFKHGFYGMVEGGIHIPDFEERQRLKPREMPLEAGYAEHLANLFGLEIQDNKPIDNLQQSFDVICKHFNIPLLRLEETRIRIIRDELRELLDHWTQMPNQKTLTLSF
jgi:hypothetical protein